MHYGVKSGSLIIEEGETVHTFGNVMDLKHPSAVIKVHNSNFWSRLYASHDLGCKSLDDGWCGVLTLFGSCRGLHAWGLHRFSNRCQDRARCRYLSNLRSASWIHTDHVVYVAMASKSPEPLLSDNASKSQCIVGICALCAGIWTIFAECKA